MRITNIKIKSGGRLVCDIYNKNTKNVDRDIDITKSALFYINRECKIEKNITLKDLFLLVRNIDMYEVLSPIYTSSACWLKEIIDEGLDTIGINKDPLEKIILSWNVEVSDSFLDDYKNQMHCYVDISGSNDGDDERYAVDMLPTWELMQCKLEINPEFGMFDNRSETRKLFFDDLDNITNEERKNTKYPYLFEAGKQFTLHDILYGVFYELSFMGGPKERDEQRNKIIKSIEEINNEA